MSKIKTQRKALINIGVILTVLLTAAVYGANLVRTTETNPISALLEGNERFITGKLQPKNYLAERPQLATGQHPYAIVLACSDSRVPPEIVFDESLGKLFVVRTAGEVVDPVALGSIEYAVEHLNVGMLMVLGHESCGAVKATIGGGDFPPNIQTLLGRIKPAVDKVRSQSIPEKELLGAAVKENVRYQMQRAIYESEIISDFVHQKKLTIAGGVYNLRTGKVEMVSTNLVVARSGGESEGSDAQETHGASHRAEPAAKPVAAKPPAESAKKPARHDDHHSEQAEPAAKPAKPAHSAHPEPSEEPVKHEEHQPSAAAISAAVEPEAESAANEAPARLPEESDHKPSSLLPIQSAPKSADDHNFIGLGLVPVKRVGFANRMRMAYNQKLDVLVKKTTLMRNGNNGCATEDCQNIIAGEVVRLVSPYILNVMGQPHLKVRYKRRTCFISADEESIEVIER